MARSVRFRLNRSGLLVALVAATFAGHAAANTAGRVDFAIGGATLMGSDGQQRALARGTVVNSGDVLRTNDGRVQMRMNDGAYISLQPNTEFGIKSYSYEGKTDGSENAFYSLVKGAMRTVTGLIGRVNRNKYQVATPTATVGIRGTGGLIQVLNDGSTLVQGTSGIWFLANPSGSIDIPAGVAGIAPVDPKQPPKETVQIPTAGPSPLPALLEFAQGDERKSDGRSVITAGVLQSGSGYAAVLAYGGIIDGPPIDSGVGIATFNATGQMTQLEFSSRNAPYTLEAGGSHADFGTDDIIAWGRWIGSVSIPGASPKLDERQGLHYVVGLPTVSMPQTGTATYRLLGATQPTYVAGGGTLGILPGKFSGSMEVTFGPIASIDANFTVAMPDQTYGMTVKDAPASEAFFSFQPAMSGCLTPLSCSGSVQGFFAGPTAERAGVGYQISDVDLKGISKEIVGTAAFTKQ